VDIATRPNQALIYRLSGDRNPLHSDPDFAAKAGFERPILHGLCTYGICCRAVLQSYADFDPAAIRRFAARFSSPTFPGDTLSVAFWRMGDELFFEARVNERGVTVIKNGRALLG
jgi:acyl dehydratase